MSARSLILGIETSCDDTGVAVIDLSGKCSKMSFFEHTMKTSHCNDQSQVEQTT